LCRSSSSQLRVTTSCQFIVDRGADELGSIRVETLLDEQLKTAVCGTLHPHREPIRRLRRLALQVDRLMEEWAARGLAARLVVPDAALDREFEARLRDTSTLAFRVAYGVLRHREDAEDVAQEAFARAYVSFRTLSDRERFRAWLVRMTWRLAIDRQHSDRCRAAREQAVGRREEADVEDLAAARERQAHVWQAIDALPERLRIVVLLANIEGHNVREVARVLDLREGTVKSRLFAARKQLAEQLQWLEADLKTR